MATQLAVVPGVADLEIDTTRTALRVVGGARKPRQAPVEQCELTADPARAKPIDRKALMRKIAVDLADYLEAVPEARPREIRSKRHRVSVPRMLREGNRPESLGSAGLTRKEKLFVAADVFIAEAFEERFGPPATFGECATKGPCVHVGCRHHLYLEVIPAPGGDTIKLNFPGIEPQDMKNPCSLRVAMQATAKRTKPRGPHGEVLSHQEVSANLGLTPERTRQIEGGALKQLKGEREDLR